MKNWLTKIFNKTKPPLAISQGTTTFHVTPTEKEETTWEEAHIVSSSSSIPLETEKPSPDNEEKETQILFEAFKKLTPEYFFVIGEMRNLLNSPTKRIVFHALSTGLTIDQVAQHLGVTHNEVITIYQEAIVDIQIQSGFVRRYLNNEIRKEYTSKFEVKIQKPDLPAQLDEKTIEVLLSEPLQKYLEIDTKSKMVFRAYDLFTIEDLLRFVSEKGLKALTDQRSYGQISLDRLTKELIRKGIFKPDGSSELFQYITKRP